MAMKVKKMKETTMPMAMLLLEKRIRQQRKCRAVELERMMKSFSL